MILDFGAHGRSVSNFAIFSKGALLGERLLKSSDRSTAYSSYAIELKFGRVILHISPDNRSTSDFSISPRGRCEGTSLKFSIFISFIT